MKKILLVFVLALTSLYANSGQDIYKNSCAMCHAMQGMTGKSSMDMSLMKAPPMPMVSQRLKMQLKTRDEFISFVDDYIQNPAKKKGFCMPMAYEKFGTMPPIGKTMSKEDRNIVSAWLYDNFKSTKMEMKACKSKSKAMKCGSGKCGSK